MFGLFLKDIFLLKKHWLKTKYIFIFFVFLLIAILVLKENSLIVSVFIAMLFLNSIQVLFADDIKTGWPEFLNTTGLPVGKIVFARFLASIIISLLSTVISFVINLLLYFFFDSWSFKELSTILLIIFLVSLVYLFILLPFINLFDTNGLTIAIILLFIAAFLLSKVNNITTNIINFINDLTTTNIVMISLLGILFIGCISYGISIIIYSNRFAKKL